MRFLVLFNMMFLLTSCSQPYASKPLPQIQFQYSYKTPNRTITNPVFSKHLTNGKVGRVIKISSTNNGFDNIKLGETYFSASGYQCRRYIVQSPPQNSACFIGGKWYDASPIILKK